MPITLKCPCGKTLRVADEYAGRRVKCPVCNAVIDPPAPEPVFEVEEPAPKPLAFAPTPARPYAKPHADADEEDATGTYGLAKSDGGGGSGDDADDEPRKKPLPDFRLGSGRRAADRRKKK